MDLKLLPTPTAMMPGDQDMVKLDARREKVRHQKGNGNGFGVTLNEMAKKGLLPTPQRQRSEQIQQEIQSGQPKGNRINSVGGKWNAPYSDCEQLEDTLRAWSRLSESSNLYRKRDWRDFPTQSPVCRGNDGLPFDVVRLTISLNKWRGGSIKGYGNAIVPQVIYEIFKAIEITN